MARGYFKELVFTHVKDRARTVTKKQGKRLNIYDFLHFRRVRLEKKDQTLKNICLH